MALVENIGLETFNELPDDEAIEALMACCSSQAWAAYIAGRRPYADISQLHDAASDALAAMTEGDLDKALAGHPRIGSPTEQSEFSAREQSAVAGARAKTLDALAAGNRQYEERFGHVYLVCATGRTAEELLEILRDRLDNDPAAERQAVRTELGKINRIRIDRLIGPARTESS
jgi:2-oxo-4-hydroxy-4-carboxy-5-ureidoimidazoline decarboxylase